MAVGQQVCFFPRLAAATLPLSRVNLHELPRRTTKDRKDQIAKERLASGPAAASYPRLGHSVHTTTIYVKGERWATGAISEPHLGRPLRAGQQGLESTLLRRPAARENGRSESQPVRKANLPRFSPLSIMNDQRVATFVAVLGGLAEESAKFLHPREYLTASAASTRFTAPSCTRRRRTSCSLGGWRF